MHILGLVYGVLMCIYVATLILWFWADLGSHFSWGSKQVRDAGAKLKAILLYGGIGAVAILALVFGLHKVGVITVPTPWDAPELIRDLDAHAKPAESAGPPPEIKSKTARPDMDAVRREHQDQLKDFEGKK